MVPTGLKLGPPAHTVIHDLGLEPKLCSCFSDQAGYLDTVPASNRAPIVQPSQPHRSTRPAKSRGPTQILAAERDPAFHPEAQLPHPHGQWPTWPSVPGKKLKSICSAICEGQGGRVGQAEKLKLTLCSWPWRYYRHYYYYIAVIW